MGSINPSEIFDYLTQDKGLSDTHALGMLSNIKHESGYDPTVVNSIGATGLFQHYKSRRNKMVDHVGGDLSDWRGQIDFALSENEGQRYASIEFDSAGDAARWFTEKFERPENTRQNADKRARYAESGVYDDLAFAGGSNAIESLTFNNAPRNSFEPSSFGESEGDVDINALTFNNAAWNSPELEQVTVDTDTAGANAADAALGLGQGALMGGKMMTDAFGTDNFVSEGLEGGIEWLDQFYSEGKREQDAIDAQERQALGEDASLLDRAGLAFKQTIRNPAMLGQQLGMVAPMVLGGYVAGGTKAVTALAAMQGAGAVKSGIYENVQNASEEVLLSDPNYLNLRQQGLTEQQAKETYGVTMQSYGENALPILASSVLAAGLSRVGAERLLGQMGGQSGIEALEHAAKQFSVKGVAKTTATEVGTEVVQEPLEQIASNVGAAGGGADFGTYDNVPEAIGAAAAGSLLPSAGMSTLSAASANRQLAATRKDKQLASDRALKQISAAQNVDDVIAASTQATDTPLEAVDAADLGMTTPSEAIDLSGVIDDGVEVEQVEHHDPALDYAPPLSGEVAATMGDAPLSANAELSTPAENIMFGNDQQVIDNQGNIQAPIETLSAPAADNMLDEAVQTPALQEEAPTRPAPTGRTLLSHLRQSGGISINQRSDIVGESNIANIAGGYGTIFRHNAEYQLQELIQDGMLDDYVPFEARSTATERTQEDIDAAYEYLADRIARGEPVLPYEAELELQMSEQFENLQAVQENNQYFSDDEVNALLQETGYDEIESASDSRIYDARGVAETEGISDSAIENPESENAASGVISGVGSQAGVEATESASATEPEAQVTYNQVDELPTNQVESVPAASTIDAAAVDAEQAEVTQIVEAFTRDKGRITNNTKAKQFNRTYFPAAKKLLEGGDVSPNKFKAAAKAFNEQDYPDFNRAFKRLEAIARYRKDAGKNEVKDVYDSFNARLESATTPDQLQALSDEVMQSDALSDAQVSRLDEAIADKLDMALEGNLPQPAANTDLLGDDNSTQQAIADAQREADARRNGVDNEGVADVEEFTLTGSDSPADQARAQGAQELSESKPDQETNALNNNDNSENDVSDSNENQENEPTTSQQDTSDRSTEATRDDGSAENETAEPVTPIDDFGEKLEGARKDLKNTMSKEVSDDEIANQPLSKIWPKIDVNTIKDDFVAALEHLARREIPSKPRVGYKKRAWVNKVKIMRELVQFSLENEQYRDRVKERLLQNVGLGKFVQQIQFFENLPREHWHRVRGIEYYPDAKRHTKDGEFEPNPQSGLYIDDRWRYVEGASTREDLLPKVIEILESKEDDSLGKNKKLKFEIRKWRGEKPYRINKKGDKGRTALASFDDVNQARNHLTDNYGDLVEAWEAHKERFNVSKSDMRRSENRKRTGQDYRNGKDVSPDEFQARFGFRGVQFGNWVNSKNRERQVSLNEAYDALSDLANILDIPTRAISLEGRLGLAFGARGKGGASAHYEPDQLVINLTKTKGAGSLAHEWFHALDNYFSHKRGELSFEDAKFSNQAYREGNYITYKPEPMMVNKRYATKPLTKSQLDERIKEHGDRGLYKSDDWILDPDYKEGVRPEVELKFANLVNKLDESNFTLRSKRLDKSEKGDGYWGRVIERGARAFESYIVTKMQEEGYHNDYLANIASEGDFKRDASRYPYVTAEEMPPIQEAFDTLFETIESEETDDGNVALFKRAENSSTSQGVIQKAVQDYVSALTSGWKNAPTIKVVADMNDLSVPEAVREQSAEMLGNPKGFYHRGVVFIVAGAHKSAKEVAETVFHEVLGHAGLRGLYGNDLIKILDQVALTKPKELKQKAEKYGYDLNDRSQRLAAAEELLTEMAETKPEVGYVKRTISAIRKWLRENVPYFKDLELTDQDIIANYLLPARQYIERGVTTHGDYRGAKPAFSLSADKESELLALAKLAKSKESNQNKVVVINPVLDDLVQEAKEKAGLNIEGFSHAVDIYGIKHAMKNHSNERRERKRGQVPITDDDFVKSAEVVNNPDVVVYGAKNKLNKDIIVSIKKDDDGSLLVVEEVRQGRQLLVLDSMRKYPATSNVTSVARTVTPNVRNDGIELIIVDRTKNVNSNNDGEGAQFSRTDPEQTAFQSEWDDLKDETRLTRIVRKLQDKFVDLKEVTESIKATGVEIDDHLNPYLQEELYHGRSAKRVKDFIDLELKPLMEDMKRRGVDMKTFEHYLWAKHAPERNAKMFEINPEQVDENGSPNGSGMTDEAANEFIEGLSASDKLRYEALAKQVYAINKKSAQMLADYGLESQATVKGWSEDYEFYVPLQREGMDDLAFGGNGMGQGFNVRGSSVKQAFGSDLEVSNILANIAQTREANVVRGEKNRVAMAVVGMATLHPKKGFWSVDNPETKKVIDPATGLMKRIIDPMYKSKPNVLVARFINRQGKVVEKAVVFDKFNDRAVHLASNLKNLEAPQVEGYMRGVAAVTRWISSVNTQYNPVFGVLNIMRDTQGALLNLSSTKLAGKQAEVSKHILPAIRGIYAEMRSIRSGKGPTDNEYAKLFEQFQKGGGQTGYRDMYATKDDRSNAIENYLTEESWKGTPARKLKDAVGGWLTDYNETLENAVRLATYKAALDNDVSDAQALSIAKNISVNFNRKGTHSVQMGALYAFFNASLQGTARIYETLSGQAGRRILAGAATLGVMQALMLEAADFGDNEPPEFIKDRNIIIPVPWSDKKYVSAPLPLGFNMLVSIPRIMTEMLLYRDDIPDRTLHMLEVALDSLNPLGGAGDVRNIIAPSVIDPVVDLSLNRDFSGRSIAIEEYDSRRQSAGHTRAKDSASVFGDYVSYSLNWLTLGTDYTAGYISPTPDQVDYLIGQVTGGVGRESIKAMQTGKSLVTGEDLPLYRIPLVGRFGGNANSQSAVASKYYDNIAKIYKHDTEIKGRLKDRKPVGDYRKDHPEAKLIMYAKGVESSRRKLRKKVREAVKQGKSKDEVKRLNDRLNSIMKRFNERYEAVSS